MRAVLVAMCFLLGCAAPQRHTLQDGSPMRTAPVEPVTAYTPAGAGLPEYWGSPAPSVERSHHARELPQTERTRREDGIWASDGAQDPTILGFVVPPPTHLSGDVVDLLPTTSCASIVNGDLAPSLTRRAYALTTIQRECLAALAHYRCLQWLDGKYKRFPKERRSQQKADALLFSMDAAVQWISRTCPNGPHEPEIPAILQDMDTAQRERKLPGWMN